MPIHTRRGETSMTDARTLIERPACIRSVRRWRGQHHRHERMSAGLRLATSRDQAPGVGAPLVIIHHDRSSDRSPLHDVRKHAFGNFNSLPTRIGQLPDERLELAHWLC
jgi:hypothetical protein